MAVDRLFLDTNVLVYALRDASPFYNPAVQALLNAHAAGSELWISRQVLREMCRTLLRPDLHALPTTSDLAAQAVADAASRYLVADEDMAVTTELLHLVRSMGLPASLIHDANIVATMRVNGIHRLLTHNVSDFSRFTSVIDIVPLV